MTFLLHAFTTITGIADQQVSQEPGQATGFDYNDPEFREVVREIVQQTLSDGINTD